MRNLKLGTATALIVPLLIVLVLALSYGIETMRARIWANELRNAGCTVPPHWSPP